MHTSFASKRYSKIGYAAVVNIGDSPHAAYFKDQESIKIEHPNEIFTLVSLNACATGRDNLQLTIKGYHRAYSNISIWCTTVDFTTME